MPLSLCQQKSNMNPLLIIAALAGVAIFASGYITTGAKLLELTGRPEKITYVKQAGFFANLLNQKFKLDLAIDNPNRGKMTFQRFDGLVYYNNKKVAKVEVVKNILLPGKQTTILSGILINISTVDTGTALFKLIFDNNTTSQAKQNFQIKGSIKANGFSYPVDEVVTL